MKDHAPAALADGSITEADLDTVLKRLFRVRLRHGYFDPPSAISSITVAKDVCTPEAAELARDGARQGIVLVKNANNALPLAASKIASAVVVGPNVDISDTWNYCACCGRGSEP